MNDKIKIGVIGRVSNELCDGQTIKTKILVNELRSHYPNGEIIMAETYNYKAHPFKLLCNIFRCMKKADVIFILLSRNGIRVISPVVHILNKRYKKPILHDCIGGSMDKLVIQYPSLRKYFNAFTVNWVETQLLKRNLEAVGIQNVEVLPNFKPLECVYESELRSEYDQPFRFCTFSRVIREKGITDAANAVIAINRERKAIAATLDIYGPIEGDYGTELDELIKASDGAIKYMGVVDYRNSVNILKEYYMLLFPTYHIGEGFPGTLIDAFSAGLPVIATDWNCNREIISYGRTGFIYPISEPHKLCELMKNAMDAPTLIYEMRKNCLKDVLAYSADTVMKTICKRIETELK